MVSAGSTPGTMLGFLECRRKKMLRGVVCGRRCAAGGVRQAVSGEQQIVCGKVVRKGFCGWLEVG
ncbi:hypothetical protein [Enterocloster bolteae]|nr:hypothetical protein [Enterocloster bolteae]